MEKTRPIGSILVALSWLLLLPSCASGPPPGPSPAELVGESAKIVVISPFNVVSALPPELESSTRKVSKALVVHLEANGKTVRRIAFRAGRDLWHASMKEVRDSGEKRNFENAVRVYARRIGEQLEFDALIVPSLFVQNAKARSLTAKWDDAEQKMEVEGSLKGVMFQGQQGTLNVRAASIFVKIVDRDGQSVHEKRRGIELIQHLQFVTEAEAGYSSKREHAWHVVDDVQPIQDEERIQEAVAAVLEPFVPANPPSSAVEPAG